MEVTPKAVVDRMMESDYFSQWMGVEVMEIRAGYSRIQFVVRQEMLNGFGIVHGGVTFALADSALAFASNSYNRLSVALSNSISYPKSAKEGDVLVAEAVEQHLGNKSATYDVEVHNQEGEVVALFRGTVYRTSRTVL